MFSRIYFLVFVLLISGFATVARATTFTVTLGGDTDNGACGQFCTLRDAIKAANANGTGADTINFNLNAAVTTIQPLSELPIIRTSLTIDGTTQPGYFGAPIIVIDGNGAGGGNGFNILTPANNAALNVTIRGLAIQRFGSSGIRSNCTNTCNLTIEGNRIGTSSSGQIARGNGIHGIYISGSEDSVYNIGGTGTFEGNIISANEGNGIYLTPADSTTANVYGNIIGLNASGNADLGNGESGIVIGSLNQLHQMTVNIGGTNPAARNIISGNGDDGITLYGQTSFIYGNYIGTDSAGNADLGNSDNGIEVTGNAITVIGGTIFDQNGGNVISGNNVRGVSITATDLPFPVIVRRNRIGTNVAGTAAVGNTFDGIFIGGTPEQPVLHLIGSETNAADGNLISGNGDDGINLSASVSHIKVFANKIGTNATATGKIPNQANGIGVGGGSNKIGLAGNDTAANVISGNGENGVHIFNSTASNNEVFNNFIGTNSSGANLGNALNGVLIGSQCCLNQFPSANLIGSASANSGNAIAFNAEDGIKVLFGLNNRFQQNEIYNNGELGIDLGVNGVNANDANDADSGANNLQNYPVLVNASPAQLAGTLNSTPNSSFTVDFYRVDSCDASGNGEGRYFIASKTVNVPNSGSGYFNFLDVPLTVGQIIVATAIDATGNTSEFSPCYTINPPPGTLSFSNSLYIANEATGKRTIVVNRTNGSFGTIQVNYHTSNETATAGQDYAETSGVLIFNNDETTKSFDVPISEDALYEANETLKLTLSFPTNGSYIVNPATAILRIDDNDPLPLVSVNDVTQIEGNSGTAQFVFNVSLSAPSGHIAAVDYATSNETATASSDYAAASGHLDFAPGETTKTVVVTVNGDLTPELNETFFVTITSPTNAAFGDGQGVGTILDDDSPGKFSFSTASYSGAEGDSVQITVLRTGGNAGTAAVDYATTNGGTATASSDYTPISGTLIFGDGETQKTFNVSLTDDLNPEPVETLNLVLSNPIGGATIMSGNAVVNILDNDSGLSIEGIVRYGITPQNQSPKTVSGVLMTATGASADSDMTDSFGAYSLKNLQIAGQYFVTPSKTGDANGITAFDATLILRHVAANGQGVNALNPNQQAAADTDNDTFVTAFDATQLLRFVAAGGAGAATGNVGLWRFLPASRSYNAMNNSLAGENYEAVIIGEVNGDWTPPANSLAEDEIVEIEEKETHNRPNTDVESDSIDWTLSDAEISSFADAALTKDGTVLIPIRLMNYAGKTVSAYSFEARFDPDVIQPDTEQMIERNETLSWDFALSYDVSQPGRIGIAAANAANRNYPATDEILLYLRFKIMESEKSANGKTAARLIFTQKPLFEDENGNRISIYQNKNQQIIVRF